MTAASLSESQWQGRVVDLAAWQGWRTYHTYDSRRSAPGFPDLVMVRGTRLIFAELKSATGRVSVDQRAWLADLACCPGIETHLWRPADWDDVQTTLGVRP